MKAVAEGKAQLPDFQRGWVWDDNRIKALILSVIHNYPVGAAMFLSYENESVRFKHKPIEGSPDQNKDVAPDELILDGQQRLTSLYMGVDIPDEQIDDFGDKDYILERIVKEHNIQFNTHKQLLLKAQYEFYVRSDFEKAFSMIFCKRYVAPILQLCKNKAREKSF